MQRRGRFIPKMISVSSAKRFQNRLNEAPQIFTAPGRVNLIGEHTDYNQGFVLPAAIGFRTSVGVCQRRDRKLVLQSAGFSGRYEFDLDHLPQKATRSWCDYVLGVAVILQQLRYSIPGVNLSIESDVPIGAGLSSSAAIEVAAALAILSFYKDVLPMDEIAKICHRAENEFIGARVGIMDQFVSCLGKAGTAMLLDCRSFEFQYIPMPNCARMVICNTMVKHEHASGEYNRRREQCDQAVKLLSGKYPNVRALRDVSIGQLTESKSCLPEEIYKRALHVVMENERVETSADYLRAGDVRGFGGAMKKSHESLRDLYEISCRELDVMVEIAESLPGCYGARMTGGGFGGCTLNFVETACVEQFVQKIGAKYEEAVGIAPEIYVCDASEGARRTGLHRLA
jgi:galactokinase